MEATSFHSASLQGFSGDDGTNPAKKARIKAVIKEGENLKNPRRL